MTHLSPTRAQGFRQTVACLWTWQTTKPLTPEQELLSACSPCERIAARVCKAELWCRAWWERNSLLVKQVVAPFVVFSGFTIAGIYAIKFGLWLSEGMTK